MTARRRWRWPTRRRTGSATSRWTSRQLSLLLRLIDKAVAERRGPLRHAVSTASNGIRLSVAPAERDTVVAAKGGTLRLTDLSLAVEQVKT